MTIQINCCNSLSKFTTFMLSFAVFGNIFNICCISVYLTLPIYLSFGSIKFIFDTLLGILVYFYCFS